MHTARGGQPMETTLPPTRPAWKHRLQAVLALLGGEPLPDVTVRFGMGRSILYKWRRRVLTALQGALTDSRPGPQCPANRLSPPEEAPLVELAQRHPTWSAAQIQAKVGPARHACGDGSPNVGVQQTGRLSVLFCADTTGKP